MTQRTLALATLLLLAILGLPSDTSGAGNTSGEPAGDVEPSPYALPEEVLDVTWQWIGFGSGKEQFDVEEPERYTIEFLADGTAAIQADCNRGRANYTLGPDRQISLSPIGVTMMLCPEESLDSRFLEALDRVRTYFEREGDLLLEAPIDSGTLRFRRPPAD
jgi:heat shock protein HslJ